MTDAELAADIAEAAGRLLLRLARESGLEGAALGAEGDRLANRLILDRLHVERPDDAVLSEESSDSADRLHRLRLWIVDPLDGTREYSEGRDDWAVHVGLAVEGAPVAGAVAVPAWGVTLRSDAPPPPPARPAIPRLMVSRTRPPAEAGRVATAISAELVSMGSAGAKTAAVLLGRGDIYLHGGGQSEWDNCAPAAVALAAGLSVTRLDGSPLIYNRSPPSVPDLLIAPPPLAARAIAILRA